MTFVLRISLTICCGFYFGLSFEFLPLFSSLYLPEQCNIKAVTATKQG